MKMNKDRTLLVSRIKTPDGTILISKHRHDYVCHTDKNGEYYFLDGGTDYIRTSVNEVEAEPLHLLSDSPFEEIRKNLYWGTNYDKDMKLLHKTMGCVLNLMIKINS